MPNGILAGLVLFSIFFMFLNSQQIYDLLIEQKITESKGIINFSFLDVSVNIKEKSAIGDLFQEWLAQWMTSNQIEYRTHSNTQEFPDFLLVVNGVNRVTIVGV